MTGRYKPNEILMISFTNATVNEMKARIKKETGADIYVATFHKLGYDIIKRCDDKAPDVFSKDLNQFVRDRLTELASSDPAYMSLVINYLAYHKVKPRSELLFTNLQEYDENLGALFATYRDMQKSPKIRHFRTIHKNSFTLFFVKFLHP